MTDSDDRPDGRVYRFAGCELDVAARELRRDGKLVAVQPKVFELIAYLVEHRDRAVDKGEIQDAVWPGVIVTETSLTQAIRKARIAVGDDANLQTVIRTVHGHGYRFVAELEPVPHPGLPGGPPAAAAAPDQAPEDAAVPTQVGPPPAEPADPAPAAATIDAPRTGPGPDPTGTRERRARWPAAVAALVVLSLVAWWLWPRPDPDEVRLAVLPVENATGDASLDWVEIGLMGLASSLVESAGQIAVVDDADLLRYARSGALDAPDLRDLLEPLAQAFGANRALRVRIERNAGLLRMSYELAGTRGRLREGTAVGEDATALIRSVVQEVVSKTGGPKRLPVEPTLVSDDPFVNEAFARGLGLSLEGRCAEARSMFAAATSQAPDLFEPRYQSALCARVLGQWREAEELFNVLLAEMAPGGPSRALAGSQLGLGIVYNRSGRFDEAGVLYEQALQTAESTSDHDLVARVLINQAILAKARSDFRSASRLLQRARDEYAAAGRDIIPGQLYSGLANNAMESGALDEADGWLDQAIDSFRAVGDRRSEAMMVNNRGFLRRLQGRLDEAEALHLESARIREELGDRVGVGRVHNLLAVVYNDRGKFTDAISSATIALRSAEEAADKLYVATAHAQLGDANLGLGRLDESQRHYEAARLMFVELGDRMRTLESDLKLAEVSMARGDRRSASATISRVLENSREAGLDAVELQALRMQGDMAQAAGDTATATAAYEAVLARAGEVGHTGERILAATALAHLRLDAGDDAAELMNFLEQQSPSGPLLRLQARYASAQGDMTGAAGLMARARDLSGSRWTEQDEALLHRYQSP
jgi:DNA-binding winged helix-turn-helix (wHTH) protein/tetratricopeptide (TPR) repeat protein